VPPLAIALVLVAAVLHAAWNVLLKMSGDTLGTALRLQAFGSAVLVPIGIVSWFLTGGPPIDPAGLGLALISGVLEAAYFLCLSAAYARGALSLVYPLARGSAPLVAVVVGVFVLGEQLGPGAAIGVACLLIGILLVSRPWRAIQAAGREHRGAIGFALATGGTIAAYSAVDRLGVRVMAPWLYGAFLAVFATAFLWSSVWIGRRIGVLGPRPASAKPSSMIGRDGLAGVLSLTAYLLILFAYSFAPLAVVAPLRESAIVLVAAWGSLRMAETAGRRQAGARIAAAGLIVLGAVLLALSP
jgi:uncharacterized membrane protein